MEQVLLLAQLWISATTLVSALQPLVLAAIQTRLMELLAMMETATPTMMFALVEFVQVSQFQVPQHLLVAPLPLQAVQQQHPPG